MYQLTANGVRRLEDGAEIPFADGNADYEDYKAWLADGNVPLPMAVDDKRPAVMDDYRSRREIYLNRVAGIALFESATGVLAACRQFRQDLLNIPQLASVLAAQDATSLTAAILAAYKTAVASAKVTAPTAGVLFDKVAK